MALELDVNAITDETCMKALDAFYEGDGNSEWRRGLISDMRRALEAVADKPQGANSDMSEFIRNASPDRKADVYGRVMDAVAAQQESVIRAAAQGEAVAEVAEGFDTIKWLTEDSLPIGTKLYTRPAADRVGDVVADWWWNGMVDDPSFRRTENSNHDIPLFAGCNPHSEIMKRHAERVGDGEFISHAELMEVFGLKSEDLADARTEIKAALAKLKAERVGVPDDVAHKAKELINVVTAQCGGYQSGRGWVAYHAALALKDAMLAGKDATP